MAKNELLKFASGDNPNITSYADWQALPAVKTGFKSGIAKSAELNRVFAQGALASNVLGAFVVEHANQDATLEGDLYGGFKRALTSYVNGNMQGVVTDSNFNSKTRSLSNFDVTAGNGASYPTLNLKTSSKTVKLENDGQGFVVRDANGAVFKATRNGATFPHGANFEGTRLQGVGTPNASTDAVNKAYVDSKVVPVDSIPVGMVAFFHDSSAPSGWLLCNGAEVSKSTYSKLYAKLGDKYGTASSSSKFKLPNLLGRFLEGTTAGSEVGTLVEAGLPDVANALSKHYHGLGSAYPANAGQYGDIYGIYFPNRSREIPSFTATPNAHIERGSVIHYDGGSAFGTISRKMSWVTSHANVEKGDVPAQRVQPPSLKLLPCIKF